MLFEICVKYLNLPSSIYCYGDYSDYYEYLADGTKIRHEYLDGQRDEYRGSLVYEYESAPTMSFGGGRIYRNGRWIRGTLFPDGSSGQHARGGESYADGTNRFGS